MKIDEQIKILMKRKAEIELFTKLADNIKAEIGSMDPEHKKLEADYPGLMKAFCDKVAIFCEQNIGELSVIEHTVTPPRPVEHVEFHKERGQQTPTPKVAPTPPINPEDDEPTDPLRFLLKHKGMEKKRVEFTTKDGTIQGTVRGLVTPNIIVETDSGYTIQVKPKELKIIA